MLGIGLQRLAVDLVPHFVRIVLIPVADVPAIFIVIAQIPWGQSSPAGRMERWCWSVSAGWVGRRDGAGPAPAGGRRVNIVPDLNILGLVAPDHMHRDIKTKLSGGQDAVAAAVLHLGKAVAHHGAGHDLRIKILRGAGAYLWVLFQRFQRFAGGQPLLDLRDMGGQFQKILLGGGPADALRFVVHIVLGPEYIRVPDLLRVQPDHLKAVGRNLLHHRRVQPDRDKLGRALGKFFVVVQLGRVAVGAEHIAIFVHGQSLELPRCIFCRARAVGAFCARDIVCAAAGKFAFDPVPKPALPAVGGLGPGFRRTAVRRAVLRDLPRLRSLGGIGSVHGGGAGFGGGAPAVGFCFLSGRAILFFCGKIRLLGPRCIVKQLVPFFGWHLFPFLLYLVGDLLLFRGQIRVALQLRQIGFRQGVQFLFQLAGVDIGKGKFFRDMAAVRPGDGVTAGQVGGALAVAAVDRLDPYADLVAKFQLVRPLVFHAFVIPAVADAVLRHQVFQAGAAAEPGADQVAAVVGRIAAVMAGFPLGRGVAHPVGLGQMELALGADDASLAVQPVVVPVGDVFAGGKVFYHSRTLAF